MHKLIELINDLESRIQEAELINETVSGSSVGWHIEHALLSINFIIDELKNSNPEDYIRNFSLPRILVFTMNKIPRGRGKAPEIVQPKNNITADALKKQLKTASGKIKELEFLKPENYIKHPYFGDLNLKLAKKFLLIHTRHHIDIIKDIIKTKKQVISDK